PEANATSATISPAAMSRASFEQGMAERFAGRNQQRAMMSNDPSNPMWAETADQMAHHTFNKDTDLLYDITGTISGGDGILRYSSGEPVTAESQAYATQQGSNYQSALLQLYNSEMAQKTPPGDILIKMLDLQEQQPARFRAMSMWPTAADFPSSQPGAASGSVKS
ncbi:hypothetical protein, partial [Devosia sp.]|uniref:hypothetical protein n=1 Tax=Devosia sp. TaxID=1871048 RepID=UPI002733BE84